MEVSEFLESFLFHEDGKNYWYPSHFGLNYREFFFGRDSSLHGWVVEKSKDITKPSKGTVLFFHSAQFNMTYNLIQVAFIVEAGYRVVLWDYAGCGKSAGRPSLEGLRIDVNKLYDWLQKENLEKDLILFGQGVGCFAALNLYRSQPSKTKAVILESPFASLKSWVRSQWGPVIGDVAAHFVKMNQASQPEEIIPNISVPLLVIFPDKCNFCRRSERQFIQKLLPAQAKVWNVKNKRFLCVFGGKRSHWHDALLSFLSDLGKSKHKRF